MTVLPASRYPFITEHITLANPSLHYVACGHFLQDDIIEHIKCLVSIVQNVLSETSLNLKTAFFTFGTSKYPQLSHQNFLGILHRT